MVFMIQNWKNYVPGVLVTWFQVSWEDGQYNLFYYISWIQTKQSKKSLSIQPQYKWRQKRSFSGCHTLIKLQFSSAQAER